MKVEYTSGSPAKFALVADNGEILAVSDRRRDLVAMLDAGGVDEAVKAEKKMRLPSKGRGKRKSKK